jgi:hypothetical protein
MQRFGKRVMFAAAVFASVCSIKSSGQTSSSPAPDMIEEDWQVVLGTPDPVGVGPQLTTCVSPVSDGSSAFFAFNLNYSDSPSFQAGGIQAKVCKGQNVLSSSAQGSGVFQTGGETITWTQRVQLTSDSTLQLSIVNGQSTTWGLFGINQGLNSVSFNTSLSSLAAYKPDTSVANSGAGWESNLVSQMTLVRVRYYKAGQLISTDTTARSVNLGSATK